MSRLSERPQTIQERFEKFHRDHPDVYELFKRFAKELLAIGRKRYGARAIFERVRWHFATSGKDDSGFKFNDNYLSRYARMLMADCPEFDGFFETRQLKA